MATNTKHFFYILSCIMLYSFCNTGKPFFSHTFAVFNRYRIHFSIKFSFTCFALKVFWSSESSNKIEPGNEKVRLGCNSVFLLKRTGKKKIVLF